MPTPTCSWGSLATALNAKAFIQHVVAKIQPRAGGIASPIAPLDMTVKDVAASCREGKPIGQRFRFDRHERGRGDDRGMTGDDARSSHGRTTTACPTEDAEAHRPVDPSPKKAHRNGGI
jgi:hypothetical protein